MRQSAVLCLIVALAGARGAAADDGDLARIPPAQGVAAETAGDPALHLYLQNDVGLATARTDLAVPVARAPDWRELFFLDARADADLGGGAHLIYSGRWNLRFEEGLDAPSRENIRHDLREAYLSVAVPGGFFFQLGRVNFKSGVALGYNPTDFFKARSAVEPLSADPSVLREDRLGTLMAVGQYIWAGGTLTALVAPKVARDSPIYADSRLPSFDPMFGRTNAHTRALIKASVNLSEAFSPEILAYDDGRAWRFGVNLTYPIGRAMVAYAEWSGGRQQSLVRRAFDFGVSTGTLPVSVYGLLPSSPARGFGEDLDVGVSYATDADITINLEYLHHDSGFSGAMWRRWFAVGGAQVGDPAVTGALWYVRGYAQDRQEPVGRDEVFLRADWVDAFVRDLHLTGFAVVDTRDGSVFAQGAADYYLSAQWTLGGLIDITAGGRRSDFGSLSAETQSLVTLTRYF